MMNLDIITVITFTTEEHYIIWIYIYVHMRSPQLLHTSRCQPCFTPVLPRIDGVVPSVLVTYFGWKCPQYVLHVIKNLKNVSCDHDR